MFVAECYNELKAAFYAQRNISVSFIHADGEADCYDCPEEDSSDDDDADCFCG